MTEKQLYALIFAILNPGFVAAGFNVTDPAHANYVDIRQAYQPTITGRPDGKAVLVSNAPARRYGSPRRTDEFIDTPPPGLMRHTEKQKMLASFQVDALAPQNPASGTFATDPTAADLVNRAAVILQSSVAIDAFLVAGVGIDRITDIRQPNFQDDRDKFEAVPSFDFTLNYDLVDVTEVPIVTRIEEGIYPI